LEAKTTTTHSLAFVPSDAPIAQTKRDDRAEGVGGRTGEPLAAMDEEMARFEKIMPAREEVEKKIKEGM
jgi:hypothetical protein